MGDDYIDHLPCQILEGIYPPSPGTYAYEKLWFWTSQNITKGCKPYSVTLRHVLSLIRTRHQSLRFEKEGKIRKVEQFCTRPLKTAVRKYILRRWTLLRPQVDLTGFVGYNFAKSLPYILSLLIGQSEHYVFNSKHFPVDLRDFKHIKPSKEMKFSTHMMWSPWLEMRQLISLYKSCVKDWNRTMTSETELMTF